MKIGKYVRTPRFLTVRIAEVFHNINDAIHDGFKEPTHYESQDYMILGKHIGENKMIFAAVKKL